MKWLFVLTILVCFGCQKSEPPKELIRTEINRLNQGELSGFETEYLPIIQIQITDRATGKGLSNQTLNILINDDQGMVDELNPLTDQDGKFNLNWKLGSNYYNSLKIQYLKNEVYTAAELTLYAVAKYRYNVPETGADWDSGDATESGFDTSLLGAGVDAIRQEKFIRIHDIVIARYGKLIFEKEFLPEETIKPGQAHLTRTDGNHYIASATKSLVSLLTGIAIDHGFIESAEDSVYSYFQHYGSFANWDAAKSSITISNFLTMRHGYDLEDGDGHFTPMNNSLDMVKYTLDAPIKHQPGTHWAYSSQCTNVMGDLLRIASGEPSFDSFQYKYLFEPLDIPRPEYIYHVKSGKPMLGAGIFMKPRDMAKIGQLVINDGVWNGAQIVSKEWLDFSTKPVVDFQDGDYYSYHWWHRDFGPCNFLLAAGNGGQVIYISKELGLVIVMTGGNYDADLMFQNRGIIEQFILPALKN